MAKEELGRWTWQGKSGYGDLWPVVTVDNAGVGVEKNLVLGFLLHW